MGILSLVGIVVNNAIVLLEQIDVEQAEGLDPYEAIVQACLSRLEAGIPERASDIKFAPQRAPTAAARA